MVTAPHGHGAAWSRRRMVTAPNGHGAEWSGHQCATWTEPHRSSRSTASPLSRARRASASRSRRSDASVRSYSCVRRERVTAPARAGYRLLLCGQPPPVILASACSVGPPPHAPTAHTGVPERAALSGKAISVGGPAKMASCSHHIGGDGLAVACSYCCPELRPQKQIGHRTGSTLR
jgi:hypothetical protein